MLFALALIPVIALLIFIYVLDKKEKEPIGLLAGLFFAGMATAIPALIIEVPAELILDAIIPYDSILKGAFMALIVIAPAEELGKFIVLSLITWKNKNFDYSYDAIVYAVFVSLGFAAIENVIYVFSNGWGIALLRMFTAVPGHACYAVIMGFFYSKAKNASLTGKKMNCLLYLALALIIPTVIHGIYDALILGGVSGTDETIVVGLAIILWIVVIFFLFIASFILVLYSSINDFCIITLSEDRQTLYKVQVAGTWTCSCGSVNRLRSCPRCGSMRPMINAWTCPQCGTLSALNFCGNCGCAKPAEQTASSNI